MPLPPPRALPRLVLAALLGAPLTTLALAVQAGTTAAGAPRPAAAPAKTAAPGAELAAALDGYLEQRAAAGTFSGAVLVARGDEVLLRAAHGRADFEHAVPLRPDGVFRIGSLTKPLTATAAMALVAQGRMRLDDSICRYLQGCPEAWRPVTLHHLLSHTSAIPDLFGEVAAAPLAATRAAIDQAVAAHGSAALDAAPGERFAYSNFNYALLGYAMEVAGRRGWEELLRETVFQPAGMHSTRYDDVWAIVPGRVRGYDREAGALRNIEYDDHSAYAAGGLLSTVDDLLAFHRALQGGRLLPASLRDRMLTPVLGGYGYGWQWMSALGRRALDHYGAIDGFTSFLLYEPERDLFIVALENVSGASARATVCDLLAIESGASWPLLSSLGEASRGEGAAERLIGSYGSTGEEPRRVELVDGALRFRSGSLDRGLLPLGGEAFALDGNLDVVLEGAGPPGEPARQLRGRRCGETLFTAPRLPPAPPE